MLKVLIIFTFLILLFSSVQAQFLGNCPANQISQSANSNQDSANPFPNELDGFKFFGEGKLSPLRLGVSTEKDVEEIFGAPVEIVANSKLFANSKTYDYNSDWLIRIYYFDPEKSKRIIGSIVNRVVVTKTFALLPEYIGKMNYVQMIPKKKIPFPEITSRNNFGGTGTYFSPWKDPKVATLDSKSYQDNNGLIYDVDYKNSESKGNFKWIEYRIPPKAQCKMYVEQEELSKP